MIEDSGLITKEAMANFASLQLNKNEELIEQVIIAGISAQMEDKNGLKKFEESDMVEDKIKYTEDLLNLIFVLSDNLGVEKSELKSTIVLKGVEKLKEQG